MADLADLATERDIATIPKVELHVHLQGSIAAGTASVLARRHGEDPETALWLQDGGYPGHYPSFEGFLDTYLAANQFVRTPDDLEFVAAEFARAQVAQHVIYSEVMFTPMICVRNGMEPSAMWAALRRGLAAAGTSTQVGLVVDAIRDFGRPEAEATLRIVEAADAPIVGLCLTGREGTVPTTEFVDFRAEARRLGLGFEVHAGEMGPRQQRATCSSPESETNLLASGALSSGLRRCNRCGTRSLLPGRVRAYRLDQLGLLAVASAELFGVCWEVGEVFLQVLGVGFGPTVGFGDGDPGVGVGLSGV